MHRQRGRVALLWLIVVSLWLSGLALADVKTERSGSIVVFPKVIADGTRDTVIQLANTSNSMVRAHCFYVNGALANPSLPQSATNMPLWQEIDFDITLTKQQPTHWTASEGRNVNPFDPACTGNASMYSDSITNCDAAGFDPGLVPPVIPGFTGELKCVEVDDSGAPLSGNHLKGEATLVTKPNGDISAYDALSILGNENNGDGTLVLGAGQCVGDGAQHGTICKSDGDCGDAAPCALEYNACPQTWILDHQAERSPNLALGGSSEVVTELTVVPCTENFETQAPTFVTLQFDTANEFESHFSVSTTVTCWGNFLMSDLNAPALTIEGTQVLDPQGSMFLQTRIRSAGGTPFGVLMVAEEYHLEEPADTAPDTTEAGAKLMNPKERALSGFARGGRGSREPPRRGRAVDARRDHHSQRSAASVDVGGAPDDDDEGTGGDYENFSWGSVGFGDRIRRRVGTSFATGFGSGGGFARLSWYHRLDKHR